MRDPLAPLLADGVIDEIVGRLKSGKEAEVWLVRHAGEVLAAKVYKDRDVRNFRNNAAYTEGRRVRDTRTQRAMARGSRFGRAADEHAWKTREADALHTLYAGGVRVPKPHLFYEGVLLMELVVDASGHPALRLIDAPVPRGAAAELYRDLRRQVIAMLCCDLVHADLSPYNVLLGRAGPVIIDLPQVVGAAHNNQAERFLRRDLENLRGFLAQHDPALRACAGDAHEIWRAYVRRELTPDFVPAAAPSGAPPRSVQPPKAPARGEQRPKERRGERPAQRDQQRRQPAQQPQRHRGPPRPDPRQPEVVRVLRGIAPGAPPVSHGEHGPRAAHASAHARPAQPSPPARPTPPPAHAHPAPPAAHGHAAAAQTHGRPSGAAQPGEPAYGTHRRRRRRRRRGPR